MTLSFKNPPTLITYDDGNTQLVLKPARVVDAAPLVTAIEESDRDQYIRYNIKVGRHCHNT